MKIIDERTGEVIKERIEAGNVLENKNTGHLFLLTTERESSKVWGTIYKAVHLVTGEIYELYDFNMYKKVNAELHILS